MESPPSSLDYLRAVQQLQKKTEELGRVFGEARRLERKNAALRQENAALLRDAQQLRARDCEWRAEFGALEAEVRGQQRHLQAHIAREAGRLRGARGDDAATAAECRRLAREVAALKRELKAAKRTAAHEHPANARAAAECAAMDQIESRALEGVRSEITFFVAENERLLSELETERRARLVAEEGVANMQQLLQRQRSVGEQQQQLAQQELQALNMQNDALLEDVKRLMEREAMGDGGANMRKDDARRLPRPPTVDRGTMTTEVLYAPLWPTGQMQTATPHRDQRHGAPSDSLSPTCAHKHEQELLEKLRGLEDTAARQALLLREKEENERRLEQRAVFYEDERRHLHSLLEKTAAAPSEKGFESCDRVQVVRAEADTELNLVLEDVINILQSFVRCVSTLRARLLLTPRIADSTVLPVVPCRDYTSPHLNAIFSHLGGLRHIISVINEIGEAASTPHGQPRVGGTLHEPTQERETHEQTSSVNHDSPNAGVSQCKEQAILPSKEEFKTGEISAWLEERRKNLQRQLQHKHSLQQRAPWTTSPPTATYISGETLEEATRNLRTAFSGKKANTKWNANNTHLM